jgi:hypothetical protein
MSTRRTSKRAECPCRFVSAPIAWSCVHCSGSRAARRPRVGAVWKVHQRTGSRSSGRSGGVSRGDGGGGGGGGGDGGGSNGGSDGDGGDGGAAATRTGGGDKTETTAAAAAAGGREGGGRRRRRRQPEHRRTSRTLSYLRIVGGTQNPKSWPWTSGTCSCRSGPHQHRPLE